MHFVRELSNEGFGGPLSVSTHGTPKWFTKVLSTEQIDTEKVVWWVKLTLRNKIKVGKQLWILRQYNVLFSKNRFYLIRVIHKIKFTWNVQCIPNLKKCIFIVYEILYIRTFFSKVILIDLYKSVSRLLLFCPINKFPTIPSKKTHIRITTDSFIF